MITDSPALTVDVSEAGSQDLSGVDSRDAGSVVPGAGGERSDLNNGALIGGIVAALIVLIAALALLVIFVARRRAARDESEKKVGKNDAPSVSTTRGAMDPEEPEPPSRLIADDGEEGGAVVSAVTAPPMGRQATPWDCDDPEPPTRLVADGGEEGDSIYAVSFLDAAQIPIVVPPGNESSEILNPPQDSTAEGENITGASSKQIDVETIPQATPTGSPSTNSDASGVEQLPPSQRDKRDLTSAEAPEPPLR